MDDDIIVSKDISEEEKKDEVYSLPSKVRQSLAVEKAKILMSQNEYVFVKEIQPSGEKYVYTGFITQINKKYIVFFDLKRKEERIITLLSIDKIEQARYTKESKNDALKIYNKYFNKS